MLNSVIASGFLTQLLLGTGVTIQLACCACLFGLVIGILGAVLEFIPKPSLRYLATGLIHLIRGLPEILVLFFIYYGCTAILSNVFGHYVDISPFMAGTVALGLIFGSYASQVFYGALLAIPKGQVEAGKVLGLSKMQIFLRIQLPQAWRHALPGLSNLWLVLLKDTAIVTLIGLSDLMNQAKLAAATTQQPFTFYLLAAGIYLLITTISQQLLSLINKRVNHQASIF